MTRVIRLSEGDSVAITLDGLTAGDLIGYGLTAAQDIPPGHKVSLAATATGAEVTKYGQVIGHATAPIAPGQHVHTHNLAFYDTERREVVPHPREVTPIEPETFRGIMRPDGQVATRNYVGIITSVNCSATVAKLIVDQARRSGMLDGAPGVDGVVAITHGSGCGLAADGEGLELLRRTLSGYAAHPNFGALLVLGLGCEVNQIAELDLPAGTPVAAMTIQEAGGTAAAVRKGVEAIRELLPALDTPRTEVPASHLVLGLKCGGSDGYSGITANPALGVAADLLVAQGGTAILAETPEIYGAERLLAARAVDEKVARTLLDRIDWWRDYTARHGGTLDNNPSPGNKDGGITTILEKSLGAVAKAGSSPLTGVYRFAEPVRQAGLAFMDTPGYDPISVTGMVAGGANIVCFTTGRGSVYGCKPVPSLKLATNSDVYRRMRDDMDLDCGTIATGERTIEETGRAILNLILATASGQQTASELLGFGDEEFAPWQLGAVM
ncbi:UxaA family hydrolase [Micromonospora sp. CB01531]|uniref:UxaA family hydrolase n=1 Tax=Micromonospora sp. CB01531 TaxID=1718947 RepID=UPI00093D4704|nr:altronate dehydratase family protein [Micromonospora sp. CB01531]OKI54859.1 galactonate dehydratase [Micromonospora sp. CB01531]